MTQRAGGTRALWPKVEKILDKIQQKIIDKAGPITVWHVDGMLIRDKIYIDFTQGGNDRAYVWMPKNTIWIDHDIDPKEINATKLHELHEWNEIGNDNKNYDSAESSAHDSASAVEQKVRDDPSLFPELWEKEIARIEPTVTTGGGIINRAKE